MATQNVVEEPTLAGRTVEVVKEYAIVVYPLLFGVSVLALGLIFQATGRYIEAGVSAATGLIICVITLVVYLIFWLLGRFGH